jgi:hypothetical protein
MNTRIRISLSRTFLAAATAAFLFAFQIHVQPFTLDWYNIPAGGGATSGGSFAMIATIGQPAAGTSSAGIFTLDEGFLPGITEPLSVETPALTVALTQGDAVISWSPATSGFFLEQTTTLTTPAWTPAPTGNPVAISPSDAVKFFRLRKTP